MPKAGHYILQSRWAAYFVAVVMVLIMIYIRSQLPISFGSRPLLILFMFPIILSALLGGFGPGIVATLLAAIYTLYIMPPAGSFTIAGSHDRFQWTMMILNGLTVSLISNWMYLARHRENEKKLQLEIANEALRQSEERYRTLIDTIPQRIFVKDKNLVYISCNKLYAKDLGINSADIAGKTDFDFYPKRLAEEYRANDTKVIESGETIAFEQKYSLENDDFWIHITLTPLRDNNRNVIGILGIFIDITERKLTEQRLTHSHDLMRYIIEHNNSAIAVFDKELKYIYVSQRYLNDYHVKDKNIIGKHHYDIFHDLPEKWRNVHKRALAGEVLSADRDAYPRADGSVEWTRWECRPWYESDGSIGGIIIYTEVITDRVLAEEELRKSLEYQRATISASPLAIVTMDPDGIVQSWNSAAWRIFGWTEKEAVGSVLPYVRETQMEDFKNLRMRILNGETFSRLDLTRQRKDGSDINVSLSTALIRDSKGKGISILAIVDDITDRKKAEAERTRLQEQLTQAQKMESVGRLAGGVAHDFNNKLGVILGYTELALNKVEPDSQMSEYLKQISIAAQRSAEITRQLLTFARKQTITPKVLNLNETIDGMIKMLQRLIGEDIELAWLPGKNLWPVLMDPSQLDQILANLCVNARDAISGVGKITIETAVTTVDEACCAGKPDFVPGNYLVLSVNDTGCGMDKETINKLFEPFFTTKEIGKGTGLGLATVYGIVKQNYGFINVYSEPGQGSLFRIYLPAHKKEYEQPASEQAVETPRAPGSENILLVEDEPSILKMATTMLELLGYTVIAADTPAKAIELASKHDGDIHLLMTDVIMPGMNGRELAKKLLATRPNIKQLFMSGYTADVIAHHGVLDEGVQFIQKPFSIKDMAAKVRQALAEGGEDARTKS